MHESIVPHIMYDLGSRHAKGSLTLIINHNFELFLGNHTEVGIGG